MATLTKTPQVRQIPTELIEAVRRALVLCPVAAAAFVWAWEEDDFDVLVVIEDELAGKRVYTRLIKAHFSDPDLLGVKYEYWEKWRPQDGFAGYEQIYLRP